MTLLGGAELHVDTLAVAALDLVAELDVVRALTADVGLALHAGAIGRGLVAVGLHALAQGALAVVLLLATIIAQSSLLFAEEYCIIQRYILYHLSIKSQYSNSFAKR